MTNRRIEVGTSRTAEWTCAARAASCLETASHYRSDDRIALLLVPGFVRLLLHVPLFRTFYRRVLCPKGSYEYVIARTRYIDEAFRRALAEGFTQVVLFGAGFDTRALRFRNELGGTRVFELDAPATQSAKLERYRERHLSIPPNLVFVPVDFDKESLAGKLDGAGFRGGLRTLFILEGVLMYLQPESVAATLGTIQRLAGEGSRVVFDCVHASALRCESTRYGEAEIVQAVSRANEPWLFGIEESDLGRFLSTYGFELEDQKDASELERLYFQDASGRIVGRVNAAHCLVTAERASTSTHL